MHWCLVGFKRWLKPPAADNGSEHSRNCLKGKYPGTPFIFHSYNIYIYIIYMCVYNGERGGGIKTYVKNKGFQSQSINTTILTAGWHFFIKIASFGVYRYTNNWKTGPIVHSHFKLEVPTMFQIFQPYDLRLSVPFWSRACTPVASTAAHKLSNGFRSETFEGANKKVKHFKYKAKPSRLYRQKNMLWC